jgi:hypothetical protein
MADILGIFKLPGDHTKIVDGVGNRSLVEPGALSIAGRVEGSNAAVGSSHEGVGHNLCVGVATHNHSEVVVRISERAAIRCRCCRAFRGGPRSAELNQFGFVTATASICLRQCR